MVKSTNGKIILQWPSKNERDTPRARWPSWMAMRMPMPWKFWRGESHGLQAEEGHFAIRPFCIKFPKTFVEQNFHYFSNWLRVARPGWHSYDYTVAYGFSTRGSRVKTGFLAQHFLNIYILYWAISSPIEIGSFE